MTYSTGPGAALNISKYLQYLGSSIQASDGFSSSLLGLNQSHPHVSGSHEFGVSLLGVTLETYGVIHRSIGFTAVIQASIHIVITAKARKITTSDNTQFYGIVVWKLNSLYSVMRPFSAPSRSGDCSRAGYAKGELSSSDREGWKRTQCPETRNQG